MKTFTDAAGRTWTITLNLGTALAVKDKLGVDLLQPEAGDPPLLTRLGTDELLLCDVIYCLLQPHAGRRGVSDEQFGEALGGEAILAAGRGLFVRGKPTKMASLSSANNLLAVKTIMCYRRETRFPSMGQFDQQFRQRRHRVQQVLGSYD